MAVGALGGEGGSAARHGCGRRGRRRLGAAVAAGRPAPRTAPTWRHAGPIAIVLLVAFLVYAFINWLLSLLCRCVLACLDKLFCNCGSKVRRRRAARRRVAGAGRVRPRHGVGLQVAQPADAVARTAARSAIASSGFTTASSAASTSSSSTPLSSSCTCCPSGSCASSPTRAISTRASHTLVHRRRPTPPPTPQPPPHPAAPASRPAPRMRA